jgi:putative peptidoglycan lipid II flippase
VALVLIPLPLIAVLFERGAFDAGDSRATAAALAIYGLGLPAFVLQKVLQPLFYAREDTVRPFRYALVSLGLNAALAVGLAFSIGYLAAAIGTTVAGWAMVWLLWRGSRGMGDAASPDAQFRRRLPRILAASALMGAALAAAGWLLAPALSDPGWRYAALAVLVGTGLATYAAAGVALGAFSPRDLRGLSRRAA